MSVADTAPAIVVDRLVKRFGEVEAVAGLSFTVQRGAIFGLLGRNGAGKTTTLECCIGLNRPTSGSVNVLGLDPTRPSDFAALRPLYRRAVAIDLAAGEGGGRRSARVVCRILLASRRALPRWPAGSDSRANSTGRSRRCPAANSNVSRWLWHCSTIPRSLFLDEPTAGMDAFGRRILWAEVEALRDAGKTIVLTTHYIEEAERLCDTICIVQRGAIVAEDTPENLIARYGGAATGLYQRPTASRPTTRLRALGTWIASAGRVAIGDAAASRGWRWPRS